MGRELQKRKRRSSRAKITMPNRRKKALNPLGNNIIAKNWLVSCSPLPSPSMRRM
jgi:nucleolar protein 16